MWRVIVSQETGVSHSMSSENKPLLLCKCLLKKKKHFHVTKCDLNEDFYVKLFYKNPYASLCNVKGEIL